jgi:hypothetical protein
MSKPSRNEQTTRTVFQDAVSRIDRVSDRYYAEYVVYIGGSFFQGGFKTQYEAENARDAAVYAQLSKAA